MAKNDKDTIEKEGVVTEALPGGKFKIKLDNEDNEVTGYLSGKLRKFRIWILPGDRVKVEFSKYDLENCRITYRFK
jgi:translation initiation factor IF-1